ncbi:hypothetical protein PT974_03193 [Cladobotryum mycophilum]|uniref:Uncharacterized protein n=1 Tax=Cladobotryum mycophilum TaxID=491253 RepID=A0ABR0SRL4_9HYPO
MSRPPNQASNNIRPVSLDLADERGPPIHAGSVLVFFISSGQRHKAVINSGWEALEELKSTGATSEESKQSPRANLCKSGTIVSSSTMTVSAVKEPLPIRRRLLRRFYEPIVLEAALKNARQGFDGPQREPNAAGDNADNAEGTFQFFVNRLAQVCDSQKGGDTVSAVAVLQEADCVHYIVGSNRRKPVEVPDVQVFLTKLLTIVAASHTLPGTKFRALLWHVLRYNVSRVEFYVGQVANHLQKCIEDHERRYSADSDESSLRSDLMELKEMTNFHKQKELDDYESFTSYERIISWIHHRAKHSQLIDSISQQSKDGHIDKHEPWINLRHHLGRLRSYYLAVDAIIRMSRQLNHLFHDFKVTAILSASAAPNPLSMVKTNADGIIGRMFSGGEVAEYKRKAVELQSFNLDNAINSQLENRTHTHVVHAEVLVLNYALEHIKSNEVTRFWNNWEYIGVSKPACRLCDYYFSEHKSGVKTRKGHGNLYPNWRFPDIFDDNQAGDRDLLLDNILQRIRKDVKRSIDVRKPQGRWHDSNSFSYMPVGLAGYTDTASISELGSQFSSLEITSRRPTVRQTTLNMDIQSMDGNADLDSEEEDKIIFPWPRSSSRRA